MANAYVINRRPWYDTVSSTVSSSGEALSLLVEMLVSAGWTYQGSGDGQSLQGTTTKVFTRTGTGAGGWNVNRAWARVRDPGDLREFVFQLVSTTTANGANTVRIKYSANARFTGGTASANTVPSATDERIIWGSGTDASPTGNIWFNTSAGATSYGGAVAGAQTVTGNTIYLGAAMDQAPYGFWFASMAQDGAKTKAASILFDPVISAPEDTDPCVIVMGTANSLAATSSCLCRDGNVASTWTTTQTGSIEGAFAHMGASGTNWLYVQPAGFAANVGPNLANTGHTITMSGAGGLQVNPFNGKFDAMPVAWFRASTAASQPGLKGWSTMARWATTSGISTVAPIGAAANRITFRETLDNKNWVLVGAFWLPWNGTTQPIG